MRSIQNLESSRDDKKRALSCVALKKKDLTSSLRFLPPAPVAARPALEGKKISKVGKDRGRGASFSLRENFRIGKAFGTGTKKNKSFYL